MKESKIDTPPFFISDKKCKQRYKKSTANVSHFYVKAYLIY
jgi:hypothetical protein